MCEMIDFDTCMVCLADHAGVRWQNEHRHHSITGLAVMAAFPNPARLESQGSIWDGLSMNHGNP